MTENETINILEGHICFLKYNWKPCDVSVIEALKEAIYCIQKFQQYRALGKVEEVREAMERQKPMDRYHTRVRRRNRKLRESVCPNCLMVICTDEQTYPKFCNFCGQKIDWGLKVEFPEGTDITANVYLGNIWKN